ncbi:MAG: DUF4908 domain-containing protein [Parvularculaceae bacterium]
MLHHCKWRTLGHAALAAAVGACLLATPATAQQLLPQRDDPFSALVGKRGDIRQREAGGVVERYVVATDNRVFLFQSDGRNGRLKFLCGDADPRIDCRIDAENPAEEIYQVTGVRASRGDVVYRNREGAEMLRLASYGSATVFWPGDDRGHAAARSYSEDPPIALPPVLAETAYARVQRATALVSALTGAPIVFEIAAPAPAPDDDATVLADAIARAAKAIAAVAEDPIGARVIASKINHVRLARGSDAGVTLDNGVVTVSYAPGRDLEGRLSSSAIAAFLEESL